MSYNKEPKRILIIKGKMTQPRYHFKRTLELSQYFEVSWLMNDIPEDTNIDQYNTPNHTLKFKPQISSSKSTFKHYLQHIKFYFFCKEQITKYDYDLIIVHLERFCFFLPLIIRNKNIALQLFTSSVKKHRILNSVFDFEKKVSIFFFKKIIIGTEWMKEKFHLYKKKTVVSRWGTAPISTKLKAFDGLRLLYIGTLTNRNIHETIEGLYLFLKLYGKKIEVSYDIIGSGNNQHVEEIKKKIKDYRLENIVKLHGYLNDDEIQYYFDNCNIGIAYIPITNYFTNVIATKLDEYLTSGMAVIATNTNENKNQMKKEFGVLVDDNHEAFAQGLLDIVTNLNTYDSRIIMEMNVNKTLAHNVKFNIVPGYESLINH